MKTQQPQLFVLNNTTNIIGFPVDENDTYIFIGDACFFSISATEEPTVEFTPVNMHLKDRISSTEVPLKKDYVLLEGEPRVLLSQCYLAFLQQEREKIVEKTFMTEVNDVPTTGNS